jgi:hypothetical protein
VSSTKGGEIPVDEASLAAPFVTPEVEKFLLDGAARAAAQFRGRPAAGPAAGLAGLGPGDWAGTTAAWRAWRLRRVAMRKGRRTSERGSSSPPPDFGCLRPPSSPPLSPPLAPHPCLRTRLRHGPGPGERPPG